jgi:hypothetical protein
VNVGDIGEVIDMQAFADLVWSRMEVARSQTQTLTQTLSTDDEGDHIEQIRIVLGSRLDIEGAEDVGRRIQRAFKDESSNCQPSPHPRTIDPGPDTRQAITNFEERVVNLKATLQREFLQYRWTCLKSVYYLDFERHMMLHEEMCWLDLGSTGHCANRNASGPEVENTEAHSIRRILLVSPLSV